MWIRMRAIIIEDEPLAAQYLAELLDETCQVEVVGLAAESEAGLRLCAELRPAAAGLYDRECEPRHGRLSAEGGGLSIEAVGSRASHGGGQSSAGLLATL